MQRLHWLTVLHVLDSSFPTGAYVHSTGLESIAVGGEALASVLRLRIEQSLARLELVFMLHAYTTDLLDLDRRYHALQLVREPREASAAIGTSFLRSVTDIVPDTRVSDFLRAGGHRHHPIAFGAVAAALDAPPTLAAEAFAFGSIRSQVAAAQRLGWIGQREAQRVLHQLKPDLVAAVATASDLELDDAGAFAPRLGHRLYGARARRRAHVCLMSRPLRIGIGGPVGSARPRSWTASVVGSATSCRSASSPTTSIRARTRNSWCAPSRCRRSAIRAVETGGCPHSAIREDVVDEPRRRRSAGRGFPDLEVVLVESGGDNLAATFSPDLADVHGLRDRRRRRRQGAAQGRARRDEVGAAR